ncbi:ArsR family transcriptional regulator [Euryarchaeota archaeon ex4484_178]|nr:MAG: ArsR family transcriptional regulator [Euryarchaeota archaeon ex4484_178]
MPASRIKVVSDIGDLVSVFHACDSEIKKKVFVEITKRWCTLEEIEEKYGEEGVEALKYLEKIKLVETQWITAESGVKKAYHTYYDLFQINISLPILEAAEIIRVLMMSDDEFRNWEEKIIENVGPEGEIFLGDLVEKLDISQIMLRGLIRRSAKIDIKGMRVEVIR